MKTKFFFSRLLILAIVISVTASCSKSSSGSNYTGGGTGTGNTVSIQNYSFSAASLTVTAGATVVWTNNDGVTHTVTADDNSFNSGNVTPGSTYSLKFATKGTFTYHCSIHTMMKGTIVVQ